MFKKKEEILSCIGVMRYHAIFQNSTPALKEVPYIQKSMMFKDFFKMMMDKIKCDDNLDNHMEI